MSIERAQARGQIFALPVERLAASRELPEMTAMLVNLRTTVIGAASPCRSGGFCTRERRVRGSAAERRAAGAVHLRPVIPGSSTGRPLGEGRRSSVERSSNSPTRRSSSIPARRPSSTAWAIW